MTKIFVLNGPDEGKSFEIKGDLIHLGRVSENDIQIKQRSVSRKHLAVSRKGSGFVVRDLNSTNGTFLGGQRLIPGKDYPWEFETTLAIGDIMITIGEKFPEIRPGIQQAQEQPVDGSKTMMFTVPKDRNMTHPKTLDLISKVSNVFMESLDIQETFERIMDYLFDLLKRIDRGAILLLDEKTGEIDQIIARSKYQIGEAPLNYSRTIVQRVIAEKKPVMMQDMDQENKNNFSESMTIIRSVMCVPLISRSKIRGVLYVDSVDIPHGFRHEDLQLFNALSSPAAMAIENATLYSNLERLVEERTGALRDTKEKLRESEARFKAVFDNMNSGVIVCKFQEGSDNFLVLALNKEAEKIENTKKEKVIGKNLFEVFVPIAKTPLPALFKKVWETGKTQACSITFHEGEKVKAWREYHIYRLPSKEIVAIFDDVTEKKKAEEEQKALQKQLLISQKMESLGAFAGGIAHNFRNILQAISGNIEYLEMTSQENPRLKDTTRNIYDSIEKGVDLINNFLHFSREGGELSLERLDVTDVIMKAYEIIERLFDKSIRITVKAEKGLYIKGNHSFLSQVFMNLFTNARDAMPNGGKLTIEAGQQMGNVFIHITDTGHGMDRKTQERIFDPFFTLKDVGKGTGLGLSISHGIIERLNGTISVSSKQGEGSTFSIFLPLVEAAAPKKVEPEKRIAMGKGQKVLIVDDEKPALESLTNLIQYLGYKTISTDRPKEALQNYNTWAPDVILVDRNMPEMDGVACIQNIMKRDPKAKIVIVSGYDESDSQGMEDEVRSFIKGYLTKPCGMEELSKTLSRVLEAG